MYKNLHLYIEFYAYNVPRKSKAYEVDPYTFLVLILKHGNSQLQPIRTSIRNKFLFIVTLIHITIKMTLSALSNVSYTEAQIMCFKESSKTNYFTANFLTAIVIALGSKARSPLSILVNSLPGPPTLPLIGNCHQLLTEKDIYDAMADYLDEGLITSNGDKWQARRKLVAPLFSYKCFYHFIDIFNRHSKDLIDELDVMFKNGEDGPKSIQNTLMGNALKIICEAAMGVDASVSSAKDFDKFFKDAIKGKEYIRRKCLSPWFKVELIWKLHPFSRVYEENVKVIKDFICKVIYQSREKFALKEENGGLHSSLQNKTVMEVLLGSGLTDAGIREEAHTLISAGHETVASTLQFAMMLLALNPEHQSRCQDEVDAVMKDKTKCPEGDFTLSALADLKYIERCVKETLRIYPIAFVLGRNLKSPLELDEKRTLPNGTNVLVVATNIHRNPEYYPEPEKFDPSRFTPENCVKRHAFAYLPFSLGPRYCLGAKFAMAELKLVLGRILYNFNIYTTDKIDDVPLENSMLLNPVRDIALITYQFFLTAPSAAVASLIVRGLSFVLFYNHDLEMLQFIFIAVHRFVAKVT
ncbi:Cytochrome P450 4C1 [Orchesella cincta]|uniref:Cytochrome P450 4C1 n=1 Tax=Orchesella cincta TaxID=48709 RepID=A0A1D2MRB8_ORCCI|nr:Cytochrome P450 4C1 [Orchesella cincta]